jgi:hypothetical protein
MLVEMAWAFGQARKKPKGPRENDAYLYDIILNGYMSAKKTFFLY